MHINNLPIPLLPAHNRRNNHKLIISHIIPYTPLMFRGRIATERREVEFQRGAELNAQEEEEEDDGG
jgi:hypothetical protein